MGLNDLVNQKEMDRKMERREEEVDEGNQLTLGNLVKKKKSKTVYGKDKIQVDYQKAEKVCPSCHCRSSLREGMNRTWECPNPDCSIIGFSAGYNDWMTDGMFMGSVEIKGWEYEEES